MRQSQACSSSLAPCIVNEISDQTTVDLQLVHMDVTLNGNTCDFSQYMSDLQSRVAADRSSAVVSPACYDCLAPIFPK